MSKFHLLSAAGIGFVLIAVGVIRLIASRRRFRSAPNVLDDAARAATTMRRIDQNGAPRARGNLDRRD